MLVLGLDLGAHCGYALLTHSGHRITSGTWNLGKRSGASIQYFESLLENILAEGVYVVGYEKVRRHRGVEASHAYGAYECIVWKVCFNTVIDKLVPISVQQIKKLATGSGSADKDEVRLSAYYHWAHSVCDDNESDALWTAECARSLASREI